MTEEPTLQLSPLPVYLSDPALLTVLNAVPDARIVGGAVRDILSGSPVIDFDLATPDRPEAVLDALTHAGIRGVPTGLKHGTVTAVVGGRRFEITTLRVDRETDGRHATVVFTADWRADASRRDFTFNAMSMTRSGEVFDYFGGIADLRAGITRFVGDPALRIQEDYLRILRFFRFHARYGVRLPDTETQTAIRAGIPGLARLSVERVWNELRRILAARQPLPSVALMADLGVLDALVPSGVSVERLIRLVEAGAPADPVLRVAALMEEDPVSFSTRLRLSTTERNRLVQLRQAPVPRPGDDAATLRRLLADTPARILIDRCWLADDGSPGWTSLRQRLAGMRRPVFPLVGRDVVKAGVPVGPCVSRTLAEIRAWWMAGGCVADHAACLAQLVERRGSS